ncbi:ATPase, T2SS/T4P/T4SS family [Idiomarina abyssalis]|uniref:Flp pilus assembly complex ATPase component TadA n=1 Tax=Idiomarina abyssalis TaxID=86102 RepID=A0A8I1KK43_9GAMM|nr:ATPase, T2SS/T4P/T4SS family [Idiomarina abyssalis]MBJ7265582.1 Flp pilus assembly complex ATPase component TadA [Idiomarina abyssalis]MBJ7316744.1 Flp pilus assembly complex ATPase component TadA [Idiomarina abyssalis]
MDFKEEVFYQGSDIESILLYLEEEGFNDLYLLAGRPIIVKVSGINRILGKRKIKSDEVQNFINHMGNDNQLSNEIMAGSVEEWKASFEIRHDNKICRYRCSATTGRDGFGFRSIKLIVRKLDGIAPKLETLNLEPELEEALRELKVGSMIVAGPTGSGKSTLMASLIRSRLEDPDANEVIYTFESPIEYVHEEIVQGANFYCAHEIRDMGGDLKTFADGTIASLRQAPTGILVGEARDRATFEAFMDLSQTGHWAATTLHVNSVSNIPDRVLSKFESSERDDRYKQFLSVSRVWCIQRLFPRSQGGRVAIREFLILTEEMRQELGDLGLGKARERISELVNTYGQSLANGAEKAYRNGDLDETTFRLIEKGVA